MVEPSLEDVFPGLRGQPYQITVRRSAATTASRLPREDIEQALYDLTGMVYGSVGLVMKQAVMSLPEEMPTE